MMGETSSPFRPCTGQEFRQALERYDGDSYREMIGSAVDEAWPAPGYREHQRETVVDVIEQMYVEDKDVVLLSAPTGAGKSLLIYTVISVVDDVVGRKSFSTTPLNTLIDQIDNDDFLDDIITIKGMNNYECVHPQDAGTSVDGAICQRQDGFECQFKNQDHRNGGCLYYGRKHVAQTKAKVYTNLSFLMSNSMIPDVVDAGFERRELLAVDETQNIDDFALLFVGFTVGKHTVPIDWDEVSVPGETASMDRVTDWLEDEILRAVTEDINDLEAQKESITFSEADQQRLDELRRFNQKASNFLGDVAEHEWTKTNDTDPVEHIEFKPVYVGRFLEQFLWSQTNRILAASATIPPNFLEEAGLSDRDVARIEVPSTFPAERRPVITTEDVGKMTMRERDSTIPTMADRIGQIADLWQGHKGLAHCHSYRIANKLYNHLSPEMQRRTQIQDNDDREGSLQDWIDTPATAESRYESGGGQLFLSVAMSEGISLDHEQARWQVICKAAYPFMGDERVSFRMDPNTENGKEWDWYNASAVIELQQAVGRGMRAKDDWCATYVLDTSAVKMIDYNEHLFEDWFLDAVDCDFDAEVVSPENGGVEQDELVDRK